MSREQAIEKALARWVRSESFRPATRSEIGRALGVKPGERRILRSILRRWQDQGKLRIGKQGRYRPATGSAAADAGRLVGYLRHWRNGRVMLEVCDEGQASAKDREDGDGVCDAKWLPFENERWGTALPGDLVEVRAKGRPRRAGGRGWRGDGEDEVMVHLVRIVRRARHQILGRLRRSHGFCDVELDEPGYPRRVELKPDDRLAAEAEVDRLVVVELEVAGWELRHQCPGGRVIRVLEDTSADDPAMMRVILRHGLPLEFSSAVLGESAALPDRVSERETEGREDWRNCLVITIDPDDARDFDDAVSVRQRDGGGWELAVHIADVAFYVQAGTALDREASERGNSVYLADRVIPMLPEKLSNGICSLRPNEDRLAQAVIMEVDGQGVIGKRRFVDTVIRSGRRLTYADAMSLMRSTADAMKDESPSEGEDQDEVASMLAEAGRLAAVLRKRRMGMGSLDLDMPEVRVVLDPEGQVTGLERVEYDESHQLIEEFMLAANETVARELHRQGAAGLHRVHEEPDEEKLRAFSELAAMHGHRIKDPTDPRQLNKFLRSIRGNVAERSLKVALLRSQKRAEYAARSLGHFGLAKNHYLHFTSPIRRYADLVVHRALRSLRRGASANGGVDAADLRRLAAHLSRTERVAAEAEMESQRTKQLQYLAEQASHPGGFTSTAVIMEVRPYSMAVELEPFLIRGWVRAATLPGGRFWYDKARNRLVNRGGGTARNVYQLGDSIEVRVSRIDLRELQVEFEVLP